MKRAADESVQRSVDRLGQNLTFVSIGVFGSAVLQYALYFLLARHLGPQVYGSFSLALTVAVLAAPFVDLGAAVSLVRTCARDPSALPAVLGASLVWRCGLMVPVGLGALLVCDAAGFSSEVRALVLPLLLATLLDGLGSLASAVFQAWERMAFCAWIMLLRSLSRGAVLLAAVLLDLSIGQLAWGYVLASATATLPALGWIVRRTSIQWRGAPFGPVMRAALPFGAITVTTILHGQIDITMLGALGDAAEVGAYHAATRFVVLAQLVPQIVCMAVNPLDYKLGLLDRAGLAEVLRTKSTALAALGACGALALALHGEAIVAIALGQDYAHSVPVLLALAPILFVKFLMTPIGDALSAIGRAGVQGRACAVALALNVGCNLYLIPRYGALGAVCATVLSELTCLSIMVLASNQLGVDTSFRRTLLRPCCALLAALGVTVCGAPASVAWGVALSVYAAMLWSRPSGADRRLGRALRAAAEKLASVGSAARIRLHASARN